MAYTHEANTCIACPCLVLVLNPRLFRSYRLFRPKVHTMVVGAEPFSTSPSSCHPYRISSALRHETLSANSIQLFFWCSTNNFFGEGSYSPRMVPSILQTI